MRNHVHDHPEYKRDSHVNDKIIYDLISKV